MKVNYEIHESHIPLWDKDDWRYAILMGGRGNGRSGTASRYAVSQLLGKEFTRGAMMRATREDIRASCWGDIVDRLNEQNIRDQFHITENDMFIERGQNSVRAHGFRASSGSLTARLKSLADYNFLWIEEAEEVGEREFNVLDDTLRTVKGRIRIVLTLNTPIRSHWILNRWFDLSEVEKGFYKPSLKKDAKDVLYIPGTWLENEPNLDKHTVERYLEYKKTNPSYYWQVIEGLAPDEARGKIYHGWELIDDVPKGARFLGFGVDWGWYPDPVAIVAIYYSDGFFIPDEVLYDWEVGDEVLAAEMKKVSGWRDGVAICGADEPKSIEFLRNAGFQAEPAGVGPGSVEYRIKVLATKRIKVTRRSVNIWREYENYTWDEDKDGNPKNRPAHKFSHSMDAVSYKIASLSVDDGLEPPKSYFDRVWEKELGEVGKDKPLPNWGR